MEHNLIEILKSFGPYAMYIIWAIVYAESGLFFGFFLPGDSLLFTAGVLASQDFFPIAILSTGCFISAVLGDSTGYWFGHRFGRRIFEEEKLPLVKKHHIETAEKFYEKHGKKTIILARFVPAVRTFAPIVAGIGNMKYSIFLSYNIIGGAVWSIGMTLAGYFLGNLIPADEVDKYLLPVVGVIIMLSVLPTIWHIIAEKREQKNPDVKLTMKTQTP